MRLPTEARKILIIDDNRAIHDDFTKILAPTASDCELDALEAALFDAPTTTPTDDSFVLSHAYQGKHARDLVVAARAAGAPYSVAFVDMRMPPGWDGLETIERIWAVDPHIQIVICSAHSDYSWADLQGRLGMRDSLLILRKPFDPIEVVQATHALAHKWLLAQQARTQLDELERVNRQLQMQLEQRDQMESRMRLTRKLETIGQLAAGIAHEISSPIQYIHSNIEFVEEGTTGLMKVAEQLRGTGLSTPSSRMDQAATLSYFGDELPRALEGMKQGVDRITAIIRAMRELAHPGQRDAKPANLNDAIATALAISAPTYRSVAKLVTDLAPLPPVTCHVDEIHQVLLNLIINAAHAMEHGHDHELTIRTRVERDEVVLTIGDTGTGIPEAVRGKIFDAFFTTKEIGKGTGQGLAIARTIVVERHGGSISFETELGKGTTFEVRLPIAAAVRLAS